MNFTAAGLTTTQWHEGTEASGGLGLQWEVCRRELQGDMTCSRRKNGGDEIQARDLVDAGEVGGFGKFFQKKKEPTDLGSQTLGSTFGGRTWESQSRDPW